MDHHVCRFDECFLCVSPNGVNLTCNVHVFFISLLLANQADASRTALARLPSTQALMIRSPLNSMSRGSWQRWACLCSWLALVLGRYS